jgi:hypothetical protein
MGYEASKLGEFIGLDGKKCRRLNLKRLRLSTRFPNTQKALRVSRHHHIPRATLTATKLQGAHRHVPSHELEGIRWAEPALVTTGATGHQNEGLQLDEVAESVSTLEAHGCLGMFLMRSQEAAGFLGDDKGDQRQS